MSYQQLNPQERLQLYHLRQTTNLSIRGIAEKMGRSHTTIYRELRRNQHPEPKNYLPDTAQSQAVERRQQAKLPFSKFTLNIIEEVQSRLKDYHSPEQIAGCLQRFGKLTMSHKTIHQMIYRNYQGMGIYPHNLRHSHRQRQRRGNQNQKRCLIPNRVGQFFPKGTNFKIVKQAEVDRVTDLIDYRPRKALDYRTP